MRNGHSYWCLLLKPIMFCISVRVPIVVFKHDRQRSTGKLGALLMKWSISFLWNYAPFSCIKISWQPNHVLYFCTHANSCLRACHLPGGLRSCVWIRWCDVLKPLCLRGGAVPEGRHHRCVRGRVRGGPHRVWSVVPAYFDARPDTSADGSATFSVARHTAKVEYSHKRTCHHVTSSQKNEFRHLQFLTKKWIYPLGLVLAEG